MALSKTTLMHRYFLGMLCGLGFTGTAQAFEVPIEGKFGISGIPYYTNNWSFVGSEAEFRLKGTPWGIGAAYTSATDGKVTLVVPHLLTGWGQYQIPLSPDSSIKLLVGAQHHWGAMIRSINYNPNNYGIMVGASYFHRWNSFWVRATPSYSYFFQEAYVPTYPAIPWAEIGYTYGPCDFSVGLSSTPIRAAFTF